MITLSDVRIIEREPWLVVGAWCAYEGDDEGPGWSGASTEFAKRRCEIPNRKGDLMLGFLYWPHTDHPEISEKVQACFVGIEVTDFEQVPEGLWTKRFSGGKYAIVGCHGDTEGEAAMGVGEGVPFLMQWAKDNGYTVGDACFAASDESEARPPYVEYVYLRIE